MVSVSSGMGGACRAGCGRSTTSEVMDPRRGGCPLRPAAPMAELLADAIADGRDGPRMTLDVARAGLAERVAAVRAEPVAAALLIGVGWTMFFPQGVVAALLTQVDIPPSWFLALHVKSEAQFLVAGGMAGV